jgi:hypothetical protein
MSKVYLKYGFIFEPSEGWATQGEFETDLGHFFKEKGFIPELIETSVGQENVPIIYLKKDNQQKADAVSFNGKSTS